MGKVKLSVAVKAAETHHQVVEVAEALASAIWTAFERVETRRASRKARRLALQEYQTLRNAERWARRRGCPVGVKTDGQSHRSKTAKKSRGQAKAGVCGTSASLHGSGSARNRNQRGDRPVPQPLITAANRDRHAKAVEVVLASTEVWAAGLAARWEAAEAEKSRKEVEAQRARERERARLRKTRLSRRVAGAWAKSQGSFRLKKAECAELGRIVAAGFGLEVA